MSEHLTTEDLIIGVVLSILSFSFKDTGYVLQKAGLMSLEKKGNDTPSLSLLLTNLEWMFGQAFTFIGMALLIVAYDFVPVATAMSLMGVGLVVMLIFCRFYLKEHISRHEITASGVIIIGTILMNLKYTELPSTEDSLIWYYRQFASLSGILFFGVTWGSVVIALTWSKHRQWKHADALFGLAAGFVGGSTLLFQTPFSQGLKQLFNPPREEGFWPMWIGGFVGFASGGVGAIVLENVGFTFGEGVLVGTLYATSQMLVPIVGGIAVFGEWNGVSASTVVLQSLGIAVISYGAWILSTSNAKKNHQDGGNSTKETLLPQDGQTNV